MRDFEPLLYIGTCSKKKEGVSVETCREVAARVWCDKEYSHIVMDAKVCEKIALLLFEVANSYETNDT